MKKAPSGIARQQKSGVICGFLTSGPGIFREFVPEKAPPYRQHYLGTGILIFISIKNSGTAYSIRHPSWTGSSSRCQLGGMVSG
jgi:hypothetical protein